MTISTTDDDTWHLAFDASGIHPAPPPQYTYEIWAHDRTPVYAYGTYSVGCEHRMVEGVHTPDQAQATVHRLNARAETDGRPRTYSWVRS